MTSPILSRTRWKLYAHHQHIIVKKGGNERFVHPLMKAFIWALYLPEYPTATIEKPIGDKYKPDVVAFAETPSIYQVQEQPLFWGEAGRTGREKIESMVKRFPDTHFAMSKWDLRLDPYVEIISKAIQNVRRNAPFDIIRFQDDNIAAIDDDGNITIRFEDVEWVRL